MARTKDKYILMDVTSTTDKAVTGILIVLTMCGILLLFWYQNFGPGIKIGSQTTLKIWNRLTWMSGHTRNKYETKLNVEYLYKCVQWPWNMSFIMFLQNKRQMEPIIFLDQRIL